MRTFKTKWFHRWAGREGLTDAVLVSAVEEMERGLVDADLGGHVVKKRVALPGRGKRSSTRTLVAYRRADKAFFIYGFAKSERTNIDGKELKALKLLAAELLQHSSSALTEAIRVGELIEVMNDGEEDPGSRT